MKSVCLFSFLFTSLAYGRFNQEQIPIQAIRDVQGGAPGVSDTIAGAAISDLLGAANACAKLQRGDQILSELGTGADAVAAAIGMVAAEKNFNNFTSTQPTICSDPTLPQNALLRGITPKIDPGVTGADVANALSAQTVTKPLTADGKSIADLLTENGFTNFISQDSTGTTGQAATNSSVVAAQDPGNSSIVTPPAPPTPPAAVATDSATATDANVCVCTCTVGNAGATLQASSMVLATSIASTTSTMVQATSAATATNTASDNAANSTSNATGADFGSCDPTMSFEAGRPGRSATEFTFQSNDPAIEARQQDALNPNIITNRICDDLTNICNANAAAKSICLNAKAQILALGTKDQSTADAWNKLVTGSTTRRLRKRAMRKH